jgi:hypothetical protein
MITEEELAEMDRRIQGTGSANCWTGTSGSVAAIARRLVNHIREGRSMARIVGLAGAAGAGKDTVADMIPGALKLAFADPLYRGLSAMLGIPESALRDRAKKEQPVGFLGVSPRRLLQTIGTEWGRRTVCEDVWLRVALRQWQSASAVGGSLIVVPDVRFENEAQLVRDQGGEVWMIHRPGVEPVAAHESEAGLPLRLIDRLVVNDGTVDQLRERVVATFTGR